MNEKFLRACNGKSKSQGGLNLGDLKIETKKRVHSNEKSKIDKMKRKELELFCKTRFERSNVLSTGAFSRNVPSEKHAKYCRCVVKVAQKNTEKCQRSRAWRKPSRSKGCVNPYAVCRKSVGSTGHRECLKYANPELMSAEDIKALAMMKGVSVRQLRSKIKQEQSP